MGVGCVYFILEVGEIGERGSGALVVLKGAKWIFTCVFAMVFW